MSRRVIEICAFKDGAGPDRLSFRLSEPPDTYPGADTFSPLTCTAQDVEFAAIGGQLLDQDAVRLAGVRLRESLSGQPAVRQAIQEAISQAKQGAVVPIYLLIRDGTQAIEMLPWETLWDPQEQFLALDGRWPIGRMSGGQPGKQVERTFNPPIRLLAFLAATGIEARPEWDALYGALCAAKLPVDLRVYLCEPDLENHIKSLPADPNVGVEVAYLPQPFDFAQLIANADESPHIIHFFCHGSTEDGPTLLLATLADWEHGESSVKLGPDEFRRIPGWDSHLWLVTLNCCESAAPDQQTSSFARALVAEMKVPAVVAMREAVKAEDANIFSGAFYAALLREIKPSLDTGARPVEIEWARALQAPRHSICQAYATSSQKKLSSAAACSKEWALPVIYVRAEEFKLRAIPQQSPLSEQDRLSIKAEIDKLRQVIAELPENVPEQAIAILKAQIASLEATLFPA